ncbi:hypothetical protein A3Q56_07100, partial [Intoshia linei]
FNQVAYPGHSSHITKVRFSKDGKNLLSLGGNDCSLIQWKIKKDQVDEFLHEWLTFVRRVFVNSNNSDVSDLIDETFEQLIECIHCNKSVPARLILCECLTEAFKFIKKNSLEKTLTCCLEILENPNEKIKTNWPIAKPDIRIKNACAVLNVICKFNFKMITQSMFRNLVSILIKQFKCVSDNVKLEIIKTIFFLVQAYRHKGEPLYKDMYKFFKSFLISKHRLLREMTAQLIRQLLIYFPSIIKSEGSNLCLLCVRGCLQGETNYFSNLMAQLMIHSYNEDGKSVSFTESLSIVSNILNKSKTFSTDFFDVEPVVCVIRKTFVRAIIIFVNILDCETIRQNLKEFMQILISLCYMDHGKEEKVDCFYLNSISYSLWIWKDLISNKTDAEKYTLCFDLVNLLKNFEENQQKNVGCVVILYFLAYIIPCINSLTSKLIENEILDTIYLFLVSSIRTISDGAISCYIVLSKCDCEMANVVIAHLMKCLEGKWNEINSDELMGLGLAIFSIIKTTFQLEYGISNKWVDKSFNYGMQLMKNKKNEPYQKMKMSKCIVSWYLSSCIFFLETEKITHERNISTSQLRVCLPSNAESSSNTSHFSNFVHVFLSSMTFLDYVLVEFSYVNEIIDETELVDKIYAIKCLNLAINLKNVLFKKIDIVCLITSVMKNSIDLIKCLSDREEFMNEKMWDKYTEFRYEFYLLVNSVVIDLDLSCLYTNFIPILINDIFYCSDSVFPTVMQFNRQNYTNFINQNKDIISILDFLRQSFVCHVDCNISPTNIYYYEKIESQNLNLCVLNLSIQILSTIYPTLPSKNINQVLNFFYQKFINLKKITSTRRNIFIKNLTVFIYLVLKTWNNNLRHFARIKSLNFYEKIINIIKTLLEFDGSEMCNSIDQNLDMVYIICKSMSYLMITCDLPNITTSTINMVYSNIKVSSNIRKRCAYITALSYIHLKTRNNDIPTYFIERSFSLFATILRSLDEHEDIIIVTIEATAQIYKSVTFEFHAYAENTLLYLKRHILYAEGLRSEEILIACGKCVEIIISVLGPDIQIINDSLSRIREYIMFIINLLLSVNEITNISESRIFQGLNCFRQMHLFAKKFCDIKNAIDVICTNFTSKSDLTCSSALSFLLQIVETDCHNFVDNLNQPLKNIKSSLEYTMFVFSEKHSDLNNQIIDILKTIVTTKGKNMIYLDYIISITSNIMNIPILASKNINLIQDGNSSDSQLILNKNHENILKFSDKTQRICMKLIIIIIDTFNNQLIKYLSFFIKIAFIKSESSLKLKIVALDLLRCIIRVFGDKKEQEFPDMFVLEQYQAQIGAALRPSFVLTNVAPNIISSASSVCYMWIISHFNKNNNDLTKMFNLMKIGLDNWVDQVANEKNSIRISDFSLNSISEDNSDCNEWYNKIHQFNFYVRSSTALAILNNWSKMYIYTSERGSNENVLTDLFQYLEDRIKYYCSLFILDYAFIGLNEDIKHTYRSDINSVFYNKMIENKILKIFNVHIYDIIYVYCLIKEKFCKKNIMDDKKFSSETFNFAHENYIDSYSVDQILFTTSIKFIFDSSQISIKKIGYIIKGLTILFECGKIKVESNIIEEVVYILNRYIIGSFVVIENVSEIVVLVKTMIEFQISKAQEMAKLNILFDAYIEMFFAILKIYFHFDFDRKYHVNDVSVYENFIRYYNLENNIRNDISKKTNLLDGCLSVFELFIINLKHSTEPFTLIVTITIKIIMKCPKLENVQSKFLVNIIKSLKFSQEFIPVYHSLVFSLIVMFNSEGSLAKCACCKIAVHVFVNLPQNAYRNFIEGIIYMMLHIYEKESNLICFVECFEIIISTSTIVKPFIYNFLPILLQSISSLPHLYNRKISIEIINKYILYSFRIILKIVKIHQNSSIGQCCFG